MIKNECELVKDLIPNYVEDMLSKDTKEFVETHINSCSKCKGILEEVKKEKNAENKRTIKQENYEIDYLKKYNKKIILLKVIAGIIIAVILVTWGITLSKYVKYAKQYEKGDYIHTIIKQAYENVQSLNYKDNLMIICTPERVNVDETNTKYYKDGKSKETYSVKYENGEELSGSTYRLNIPNLGNLQIKYNDNSNEKSNLMYYSADGDRISVLLLHYFYGLGIIESSLQEIREDTYDSKECYVVRRYVANDYYEELWIDKTTYLPVQEINVHGTSSSSTHYTFSEGTVTDEDVALDENLLNVKTWDEVLEYAKKYEEGEFSTEKLTEFLSLVHSK